MNKETCTTMSHILYVPGIEVLSNEGVVYDMIHITPPLRRAQHRRPAPA